MNFDGLLKLSTEFKLFLTAEIEYLYHETKSEYLPEIIKFGLQPKSYGQSLVGLDGQIIDPDTYKDLLIYEIESDENYWYLSENEIEEIIQNKFDQEIPEEDRIPRTYVLKNEHSKIGNYGGNILLRFPKSIAGKIKEDADFFILKTIPPEYIEIKKNNKWTSLIKRKIAASQPLMKLKTSPFKNQLGANLWFTARPARFNNSQEFAIFDRQNIEEIKKLEIIPNQEILSFYANHEKIKELMEFIINSYNKYFPGKDGWSIYHMNSDLFETSDSPIFLLIHDLIHYLIESNFEENLRQQSEEDQTVLIDEINEDIASMLSNFEPVTLTYQGPFLGRYLEKLFLKYFGTKKPTIKNLSEAIEKTFYQAKAELRGKIDKILIRRRIGIKSLKKYRTTEQGSSKIKQLVDGFLSHCKNELLDQIPRIIESIKSGRSYQNYFNAFKLEDLWEEYRKILSEGEVFDEQTASSLRAWMLECLNEMKKVNRYFKYELHEDYFRINELQ